MTETRTEAEPQADLRDFELGLLTLDSLDVERFGFTSEPGTYNLTTDYRLHQLDDMIIFTITNTVHVYEPAEGEVQTGAEGDEDEAGDPVARIAVTHGVVFRKRRDATMDDHERLLRLARLAIYPLVREKVLTLSADMLIPPIALPVLHAAHMPAARELSFETLDESASVE